MVINDKEAVVLKEALGMGFFGKVSLEVVGRPPLIPFLNHYEIRRTDDDSADSTARKVQQHIVMI